VPEEMSKAELKISATGNAHCNHIFDFFSIMWHASNLLHCFNTASLAQVVALLTVGLLQVDGFLFQLMLAEEGYMPVELNLALAIGIQERTEER
jgi:hypothetical protein